MTSNVPDGSIGHRDAINRPCIQALHFHIVSDLFNAKGGDIHYLNRAGQSCA
jgi:hypothetical protein